MPANMKNNILFVFLFVLSVESKTGLIYSVHKNCGKSLSLHIISKGEGIPSRRHQNTSGTSE